MSCRYCHEDSDGYVEAIGKNAHVYLHGRNELVIRFGKERRAYEINYCPMCGRDLSKKESMLDGWITK